MKLSEIVRYRNQLDEITPGDVESSILGTLDPVLHTVDVGEIKTSNLLQELSMHRNSVMSSVMDFRVTLEKIKREVDQSIESMEPAYLANSYLLYQEMQKDKADYILKRRLASQESTQEYIANRVLMHNDWRRPAAVIRPGVESFIDLMVACDPLYVIDTDYDLFKNVKEKFNKSYINRLCFYKIQESDQGNILQNLPNGQFSFILAYNFFHYKPFEIFKQYLIEIYDKLAPGGTLAFTFNDCTRWGAVSLAENWFMCYTPGRLVRSLCENLGYDIVNSYIIDNATTWLEVRKPGQRISIRGGQSLARIIDKSK